MAENAQMPSPPAFSDAAGQEYQLMVTVTPNGAKPFLLDTASILQFDYQMQLNDLVTRGSLTYVDSNGRLDGLMCRPYGVMHILFTHSVYDVDASDGAFPPITESNPQNPNLEFVKRINSDFLVESVGIAERNAYAVVYKLEFTGINITSCIGTVDFSNYGKKPEPVLDIFMQIAARLGVPVDAESFGRVKQQPTMNYITNGNDNLFTSAKFLLDKLYYRFPRSEAMVFVFWDELEHALRLFDMSNPDTVVGESTLVLGMYDQFLEQANGGVRNELGTVTRFPTSRQAAIDYDNQIATYDYDTNKLGYDSFSAEQARQYVNARFMQLYDCEDKYQGIRPVAGEVEYRRRGSYWNNDFHFYGMFMDAFLNSNALLVKSAGMIDRIPGCVVDVSVDKGDENQYSEDPQLYDEMMRRYKGLQGVWVVTKVHNYVKPNSGKVESFRQVLTLARNFVWPIEDQSAQK